MSDIDWSKAPEGATHYNIANGLWYRYGSPFSQAWIDRGWNESRFSEIDCYDIFVKRPEIVEWDGEGLPPAGCLCEFKPDPSIEVWIKCVFIAKLNNEYIVDVLVNDFMRCGLDRMKATDGRFRPIKTEKERAVDDIMGVIGKIAISVSEALYNAGYRRVEK